MEIIKNIEGLLGTSIDIENTIIFIDEIQVSERAISSLKYFCESEEKYKIVVAGSLLGVKVNRFKSSFPVGKVWLDYLYPMDFEEFLMVVNETKLLELIKESYNKMIPMLDATHNKALSLYNEYICLGGMPAAILNYIEHDKDIYKFEDSVLNMIITSYFADMSKYTENIEALRNNKIYNSMPAQLGKENKKFKYSLVEKSARSREYESSMEWLLSSNQYEVDFLINIEGDIIPVEVKASDNTSSKSLNYYIKRFNPKYAIRISSKNFGMSNGIKSIPLYASFMI